MSEAMDSLQEEINRRGLQWAVETVDDDDDIESFVEGIPEFLNAETSKNALPIIEDLCDPGRSKPLGLHINRLIQTCTADGYRGTDEGIRRRRALICLDTVRILTAMHSKTFFHEKFGDKTWSSVHSLEQDKDSAIAINAVSTGAMAACAYLHFVFKSRAQAPNQASNQALTHIKNLRQLVTASWHVADLNSFPQCHLLVLHGFVSSLHRHLSTANVDSTNFRAVWETLPWILNIAPSNYSNLQSIESFLALWAQLEKLAGEKPSTDVDDLPPIVRLMSMLRPTVESIRVWHVRNRFRTIVRKKVLPGLRLIRTVGRTSNAPPLDALSTT